MDDPNITMEEYIKLEEEKARRQGRTFNWQTATYGKLEYYEDEDDSFTNLETEYPAIVFDDTSDAILLCEPTHLYHSSVSLDSTTSLSPDHPLTHISPTPTPTRVLFHRRTVRMAIRTQPTLSPGMSTRIAEAATLSLSSFCKRYRSSYETPSPSSSPTLPVRKRYRGTSELILDIDSEWDKLGDEDTKEDEENESLDLDDEREVQGLDNEGQGLDDEGQGLEEECPGIEEEEEATPEGQQQAVLVVDTTTSKPLGLGYGAARPPPAAPIQTPPSLEWSLGSLPVSPSSIVVPSPIALPMTTPATKSVDEDQFLEGYDRDLRELYTRSGAVRDDIFSQRYRFRSLEREQERATRENHDLRRQLAMERRERLELTDHVARIERR
ncbi:hypothetical protein Tco_0544759 [Tanacetum coccineum]